MEKRTLSYHFNEMLNENYGELWRNSHTFSNNKNAVFGLVRLCCEEANIDAIRMAFERTIGKVAKPVVIRHISVQTRFPYATRLASHSSVKNAIQSNQQAQGAISVQAHQLPSHVLTDALNKIGGSNQDFLAEVLDNKKKHNTALVVAANLYAVAQSGKNMASVKLLFELLDGAVADVVEVYEQKPVQLTNYAEEAPANAKMGSDGVYFIEQQW